MKYFESILKKNVNYPNLLVVFALVLCCMFSFSGCSAAGDAEKEITASTQEPTGQTEETTQPVDHNVDMEPTPLEDVDKALSLEGYGAKGALTDADLSINDMLMYAVQDEYLARGEYLAIMDKFGSQRPYSNIVNSEETHLAYLQEVYRSYGLVFPPDTSAEHIVVPADLLEAAKTGVQAEIDNIAMYELFLTYELPDNIFEVFTALKNGSDSHLLAF